MITLIESIKLAFKTKNFFCRVFVILWLLICAFMVIILAFSLGSEEVIGSDVFGGILLLCFFATSTFLIPAISIAQGKNAPIDNNHYRVCSEKSWGLTLFFAIFFGHLGVHRFYVGRKATGVIYIFTMGGFSLGWFTDIILILTGKFTDKYGHIICGKKHALNQTVMLKSSQVIDDTVQRKQELMNDFVSVLQQKVEQNTANKSAVSDTKPSVFGQMEDDVSVFSEVVVSGNDEKRQEIPIRAVVSESPSMGSHSGISVSVTTNPIFEEEDTLDFDFEPSYSGYSSHSKFIKDMQKYVDKVGEEAPFVPFMQYWSTYDSMDRDQKAWYFYWRNEVRSERYPDTDLSYIFVHIYEILSGFGWNTAADGYSQLMKLWEAYRERFPRLDYYLVGWTFDFTQLHNLDYIVPEKSDMCLPSQLAVRDMIIDRYGEVRPLKLTFALVDALCDYSITASKFYKDGNQLLMNEAIPRVVALVDAVLLKKKGRGILEIYGPNRTRKQSYYAFQGAICPQANERIDVSVKAYTSSQRLRGYINEIVRYAENVLREVNGYRGRLRGIELDTEMAAMISSFLKKEYSRKKVVSVPQKKVDINLNLAAIETLRAESEAVRDALEVVDEPVPESQRLTDLDEVIALIKTLSGNAREFLSRLLEGNWSVDATSINKSLADEVNRVAIQCLARELLVIENNRYIVEDDYRDEIEYVFKSDVDIINKYAEENEDTASSTDSTNIYFDVTRLSEELGYVVAIMTNIQQQALWAIVTLSDPKEQLIALADEGMTMPEILIDEINEIAAQQIDDILIDTFDDTPCVLEQYEEELKKAVIMEGV